MKSWRDPRAECAANGAMRSVVANVPVAEVSSDEPQNISDIHLADVARSASHCVSLLACMGSPAASDGNAFRHQLAAQRMDAARYRFLFRPRYYRIRACGLYDRGLCCP